MNIRRIVEIAWMAVAAVCTVEFVIEYRKHQFSNKAFILLGGLVVAIFMYSLRKRMRKKIEEYNESNKDL